MIKAITDKMTAFSNGNMHDITHFLKVLEYAQKISSAEKTDDKTARIIQIAAIVHDIACPSLRERYGKSYPKLQESEGMPMVREFLAEFNLSPDELERIVYLVGHHHSPDEIDGADYRILIEADYIQNAAEGAFTPAQAAVIRDKYFKTESGKAFFAIY